MKNRDIRNAAAGNGVFLWQVADVLGIADSSFSRKLRNELSAEEKQKILAIKIGRASCRERVCSVV